jgi:hypothetical protein
MANPKQIMMLMETDIFGIHAGTSRAVPGASQVEAAERNHSGNVYSQAKRSALPAPPRQVSHSVQQRSQAPYLPARQAPPGTESLCMRSVGNHNPPNVPGFELHLIRIEQVAGGALATFQVLDRDPLQQMAVTVYATADIDGIEGVIARAREEAINLLRRSICLLHAERTLKDKIQTARTRHGETRVRQPRPRAHAL